MPLLLLNLRAQPSGLVSHRKFLQSEAGFWLGEQCKADITFTCVGTHEGATPVHLTGHQAVLAPLSPLLKDIFSQHSCGPKTQMADIIIPADPQVMKSVLTLVYKGVTTLSTMAVEELKSIVKMLNLTFPGGFERVLLSGNEVPAPYPSPTPKTSVKRARESSPSAVDFKKSRTTNFDVSSHSNKVSATDRMNMHVSMTLQLKDSPSGTTATCNMPQCGAEVTYEQLSDHFLIHETSDGTIENRSSFPCVACGISFKLRKELDTHTKNKHGGGSSIRDKLDLLSESDSSDEETLAQLALKEKSSAATVLSKPKPSIICRQCNKLLPSLFHLAPSQHDCEPSRSSSSQSDYSIKENYCNLCNHTFKTTKAKKVHMQMKHSNSKMRAVPETSTNVFVDSNPPVVAEAPTISWKKFGCQICTKRFNDFCKLRTHYTLYHFWNNLCEDYKYMGDTCTICMKRFPTEDHFFQHMGNFHCIIDKYLVEKGMKIISEEKTVKLLSWKCDLCQLNLNSSAALKSHLAVKHYQKELMAEFPVEKDKVKKCPKCYKIFEGSSINTVVAHVGSFHDEVIKYAVHMLDLHEEDKAKIPVDDFDDGSIGVLVKDNAGASPKNKKEMTTKSTFDFLFCQICLQEVQSSRTLKIHYIRHFQYQFQKKYFTDTCPICMKKFENVMTTQKHIATDHSDQSLIPLMEDANLWVDKSEILESGTTRVKRFVVNMKKIDKYIVNKYLGDVSISQHEKVSERKLSCAIPSCDKVFAKREQFLTHLAISHFWKDLTAEFGERFKADALHCPECKECVNPNMDKTTYYKHLSVVHEIVMKYVQTYRKEGVVSHADTEMELPSITSTLGDGDSLHSNKSNDNIQDYPGNDAMNYSEKESEIDRILRKHGASYLVDGTSVESECTAPDIVPSGDSTNIVIKKEVTTEENPTVASSSELLSKIRNVFSDESDSD